MKAVAILIPAVRPHRFEGIVQNIADTTDDYGLYWMVGNDECENELRRLKQRTYWRDEGGDRGSWGIRCNYMYAHTRAPYLFCASDDSLWHQGWLQAAMAVMEKVDGVVMTNDLNNAAGTLPLISRNYIKTMSGVKDQPNVMFHEGYRHAYVESELRDVARARDRYAYCAESIVEHLHVCNGKAPNDEWYVIGNASMTSGHVLYNSRLHL